MMSGYSSSVIVRKVGFYVKDIISDSSAFSLDILVFKCSRYRVQDLLLQVLYVI